MFKTPTWDSDAREDNFQELFQKSKKRKDKKSKVIGTKIKKAKKKLKNINSNVLSGSDNFTKTKLQTSDTVNLITQPFSEKQSRSKKKNRKINNKLKQKKLNGSSVGNQEESEKLIQNKHKKGKTLIKKNSERHEKKSQLLINDKKKNENLQESEISTKKRKKLKRKMQNAVNNISENISTIGNVIKENPTDSNNPINKKKKKKRKNKSTETPENSSSTRKVKSKQMLSDTVFNHSSLKHNLLGKPTSPLRIKKKEKFYNKLKEALNSTEKVNKPVLTLRQKMMEKLKAARFRFINEQIYTVESKDAQKIFKDDPNAFKAYHEGYRKQVKTWPMNPLTVIITSIKKMPKTHVIADFGCGDAVLSKSVPQKVHSFDLVAVDDSVVACDMSKVPLDSKSIDVAVYCLSLMGTNLRDYLLEANRVLKVGGILKVAEVESRFEKVEDFIKGVQYFGFKNTWSDLSHNLFYFLDFKKERDVKNKNKLPTLSLLPCLYKKR